MMRSRPKHGKAVTAAAATCSIIGEIAALSIGIVAVEIAAHDDLALVRLVRVEVPGAERDHGVQDRLYRLGHHRLQEVRLDRQREAGERGDMPCVARDRKSDLVRADEAARGLDPADTPTLDAESRHLAVLDDVDATRVRRAGKTPRNGIVASIAGARLEEGASDREARRRREIQRRREPPYLLT